MGVEIISRTHQLLASIQRPWPRKSFAEACSSARLSSQLCDRGTENLEWRWWFRWSVLSCDGGCSAIPFRAGAGSFQKRKSDEADVNLVGPQVDELRKFSHTTLPTPQPKALLIRKMFELNSALACRKT